MKNDKLIILFYNISVGFMIFGSLVLIADMDFDIYSAFALVVYLVGAYLINKK